MKWNAWQNRRGPNKANSVFYAKEFRFFENRLRPRKQRHSANRCENNNTNSDRFQSKKAYTHTITNKQWNEATKRGWKRRNTRHRERRKTCKNPLQRKDGGVLDPHIYTLQSDQKRECKTKRVGVRETRKTKVITIWILLNGVLSLVPISNAIAWLDGGTTHNFAGAGASHCSVQGESPLFFT